MVGFASGTRTTGARQNVLPTEGQVADGTYSYVQGGAVNTPSAGAIYSGGQWLTPAQYQQAQAQQKAQQVYTTAGNKLNALLQNPSSITDTPGYKFAYNQGLEAVNRTAAAKGMLGSGNRLYDLTKFGQGLASQTYNNTISQLGNFLNKTPIANNQSYGYNATANSGGSTPLYYGGMGG